MASRLVGVCGVVGVLAAVDYYATYYRCPVPLKECQLWRVRSKEVANRKGLLMYRQMGITAIYYSPFFPRDGEVVWGRAVKTNPLYDQWFELASGKFLLWSMCGQDLMVPLSEEETQAVLRKDPGAPVPSNGKSSPMPDPSLPSI